MILFGPDLSHYQQGLDVHRAAAEGHTFLIGKISQGATGRDPAWPTWRNEARRAGLLLAGYHYITTEDPNAQAVNCANWIGDRSIPIALDWEAQGGSWRNFMATLVAFRACGLNVRLAYVPRWYWQQQGSPDMSRAGLPLWSSRYPSTAGGTPAQLYRNVGATHWAGYGGLQVALVQFSDKASVAGHATDCSAFNGTRDQLAALLGGAPPPVRRDDVSAPPNYPVSGKGSLRLGCPVGKASQIIARAWVSALANGPGSSVRFWFQNDTEGMRDSGQDVAIPYDNGHSGRVWDEFPDGATQVNVTYNMPAGGVLFIEVSPK